MQGASLDVGNLGCRALAASFIKLATDVKAHSKIHLLYGNRTSGVQTIKIGDKTIKVDIVNYRLSPRARLKEHVLWILLLACIQRLIFFKTIRHKIIQSNCWLRTLEKADFVGEIRGGDSFSDIYGLRRFVLGILPCIIAILMRKKIVLLPQTYGPFRLRISKLIARFILSKANRIFARDKESIEFVHNLMGQKDKAKVVEFCPDVAFTLQSTLPQTPNIEPPIEISDNVPLIGLNISGLLYVGGYTRNNMFGLCVDYKQLVNDILLQLLEKTNAHILLIPHELLENSDINEILICRKLMESVDHRYAARVHMVNQEYDQSETKGIIGLCDFFIGARMHACIAALSQNIPTVGLAYSKKFHGVFQSAELSQYVADMRHQNQNDIITMILNTFERRESIRKQIQPLIKNAQEQIVAVFTDILG